MTRKQTLLTVAGSAAALFLLAVVGGILVLRSDWFHEQLRRQVVIALETATGGRVEIGSVDVNWIPLRVEIRRLTLHGTEPAGKPPLLRAASATVGLTIESLFRRDVSIQSLDVQEPQVYLIVDADGRTNVPEPKIKPQAARSPFETLVNLAIGRFNLRNGMFEVEARSRTPFDLQGRNLAVALGFDFARSLYRGELSVQPLDLRWDGQTAVPLGLRMALTLERNRMAISSARLTTGDSAVDFSGALDDMLTLRANFRYQARISAADVRRVLRVSGLERGTAEAAGTFQWAGASSYTLTGNVRGAGVTFRQSGWQIRNASAEAALRADPRAIILSGVRFAGESVYSSSRVPVRGRVADVTVRGRDLAFRGFALEALGGSFAGEGEVTAGDRYRVRGTLTGLGARRAVAAYNPAALPWDSLISGTVSMEGSLRRLRDLRASANLTLAPAPQSAPVRGQIAATYDAAAGLLDLGRSSIALPSSRIDLSGAIGRQMQVHLVTRDLNDFLPVLGQAASSLPVKLRNGSATFDGTVTGRTEDPRIDGRIDLSRFSYGGQDVDSLSATVGASSQELRLQNAALARGTGRLQFQVSVGLQAWQVENNSMLAGSGSIRNEPVADLLALAGEIGGIATGTVNSTGQIAGTVGDPQLNGVIEVVRGSFAGEPYDLFTANVTGTGRSLQLASGQWVAGPKRLQLAGSFDHPPDSFSSGRLRLQMQSNALPLDQIRTLDRARPGIRGTVQVTAGATIDLMAPGAPQRYRVAELQGDVTARGLQLTGQPLGDAHLTAQSQGAVVRTHLDSSFAGSTIRGDGQWRLEGDYPGSSTLTFSRVDLAALRDWIAPNPSGKSYRFAGFAAGEIVLNGPALKPELMQAELRIPDFEVHPAPDSSSFAVRNSGPIVARMANGVFTLETARLTGPSTDLSVTGQIALPRQNPLDLRVSGRVDLAVLTTLDSSLMSSGTAAAEATIRGPFSAPQLSGRVDLTNAAVSYADFPNGITNATGTILFTGDQATIQNLTGETGGGKVQVSGFAGMNNGSAVFRLHATASQVRVRYPEGVSTVADADLNLTGTSDRSMLGGTLTIRRTSFNLQSDFGSAMAKSAEPVRTLPVRTGFLGGLNYDVQIETAPDIQFESALTQGLQADANLRLRGTASSPALLGRINITQGQMMFFGTKYNISQGSISFFNPARIEPVLNIDLETKARGIDITLSVSGPLNKLNLTPRSDPPLQFSEIISVLATGENPTSTTQRLGQQAATAEPFQQTAASALLGQALASPVSGRLQRFFGISKLRIDPSLPGVEYNPQARLTLEQQVTPQVTFTYITNVTNANPQVVSVEWAMSKQWSAVAIREENGLLGLDFFYKKRFK